MSARLALSVASSTSRSRWVAVLALLVLVASGCKKPTFKPNTPEEMAIVSSELEWVSEGAVGSRGPIEVRFVREWAADDEVGKEVPSGWLDLDPSVKGRTFWKDHKTLRFEPAQAFELGEVHVGTVDLPAITGKKGLPKYRFRFEVAPRSVDLEAQGFTKGSDGKWTLSLKVAFSSNPPGDSTRWFTASLSGSNPVLRWVPSGSGDGAGVLEVAGLERNGGMLQVAADKDRSGVLTDSVYEFRMPKGDELGVLASRSWSAGDMQGVEVLFSDPIASTEEVRGFVKLSREIKQIEAGGNRLRVGMEVGQSKTELRIAAGFPAANGRRLPEPYLWVGSYSDLKPRVAIEGSGLVLPTRGENQIHFASMNLGRVNVSIQRIRIENVPELIANGGFEQASFDGGRRLLGELVWNRSMSLGAQRNKSFAGTLDLGPILAEHGPGVYRVRLEPVREGMLYGCEEGAAKASRVIGEASSESTSEEPQGDGEGEG